MITFHDLIGLVGITISTFCYARVQWQREYAKKLGYSLFNLIGSSMLGLSLLYDWNLAAFVSNAIWVLISAYGVFRCAKYMWRERVSS